MSLTLATESEIELAEAICGRAPSFQHTRFTNAGTEAVMHAIKGARAYTGRPKIAKCEGVYHGAYDYAEASLDPDPQNWGTDRPRPVGYAKGTPAGLLQDAVIIPFNDVAGSREILDRHAGDLAAVLVDLVPARCGGTPMSLAYIDMLHEFRRESGALIIDDEVITFRLHEGGAQTLYGLEPDLTTLGKVIGGGLPIGAVAGTAERDGRLRQQHWQGRLPAIRHLHGQPSLHVRRGGGDAHVYGRGRRNGSTTSARPRVPGCARLSVSPELRGRSPAKARSSSSI